MKRTPETQAKYEQRKKEIDVMTYNFSDEKVIHEDIDFKIVENSFPYDELAEVHHLLIPTGFKDIFSIVRLHRFADYDSVILNFKTRTVGTEHAHLITWKK